VDSRAAARGGQTSGYDVPQSPFYSYTGGDTIAARGRRTGYLKVQISLSFSFTVGFFFCCPLLL